MPKIYYFISQRIRASHSNFSFPIAIALFVGLDYFDNTCFSFFISYTAGGVNSPPDELVWSISAYAIASVLGILQQLWIVQRIGYRYYLTICLLGFSLGAIGVCLSESSTELTLARALQGYCIGPMLSVCRILLQNSFSGKARGLALRFFLFCVLLASATGPLVGGNLIAKIGWQAPFIATAFIGALLALLAFLTVPEKGRVKSELKTETHFWPYIVFAVAFSALQIALQQTRFELFLSSPVLPTLTIIGLLALCWFVYHQWNHPHPLLNLHAFSLDTYRTGLVIYMFFYYISNALGFLISRALESGLSYPVQNAGNLVGYTSLLSMSLMVLYFSYASKINNKKWIIVPGCLIAALICYWLMNMSPDVSESWLFPPLLLRGALLLSIALPTGGTTFSIFNDDEYNHGYRIKNIVKQIIYSFSTASVIILEQHRNALHYTRLAENINLGNPNLKPWLDNLATQLSSLPNDMIHSTSLTFIQQNVIRQSELLSLQDCFLYLFIVSICAAIYSLIQKRI
ncbi:TPA: MFS transporter [Serratia marcescens]|nr:MFS transporter [Serratia marcescens]